MMDTPHANAHDTHAHYDDGGVFPLIFSLVLHGLVIAVIAFWHTAPKIAEPAGMETVLVGAGEFAEIEGALQDSAAAKSVNTQNPTPEPSSAMSAYDAELAARQAAYEAEMAKFAAEIDAEMAANQQAHEAAMYEMAELERQAVEEAKRAEQSQDDIVKHNQAELDKARSRRDEIIAAAEAAAKESSGTSGSMGSGMTNNDKSSGTNATRTTASSAGGSGQSANNIAGAVARHIYPNWEVPSNAKGERLSAKVEVDASGNVMSISITGGSPALKDSLEKAIRRSSPLTPVIGTDFRRLNLTFVADN